MTLFANYAEGFRTQFPRLSTRGGVTIPQLLDPEETESYEGGVKVTALNDDFSSQEAGNAGAPRNFFVCLRADF